MNAETIDCCRGRDPEAMSASELSVDFLLDTVTVLFLVGIWKRVWSSFIVSCDKQILMLEPQVVQHITGISAKAILSIHILHRTLSCPILSENAHAGLILGFGFVVGEFFNSLKDPAIAILQNDQKFIPLLNPPILNP